VRCGAGPGAQAQAGQKQAETGRGVPASANCIIGESRSVSGAVRREGRRGVSCERRGEARSEWSGCDRRQAHSTAQHSTTQHSSHNTVAQAQAHTDESFIHQDLFCMPRAHSRKSRSRAGQTEQSIAGAHPLFTRRRQRGSPASLCTGRCQTGPICRETKHLADDRPGQQRSSAGMTLKYERG
jgi:hypothetical protein